MTNQTQIISITSATCNCYFASRKLAARTRQG